MFYKNLICLFDLSALLGISINLVSVSLDEDQNFAGFRPLLCMWAKLSSDLLRFRCTLAMVEDLFVLLPWSLVRGLSRTIN